MAAEQIIHPASPPPDAPKYYYPGFYYYTPEPYQTTHVPNKQHHLLHHVVHLPGPLRHAVHDLAHPYGDHYPLPAPPCDIRETGRAYHLDVELPGARGPGAGGDGDKDDDVRLRWTGTRTLFVAAKTRRGHIPPHDDDDDEGGNITTTTTVKPPAPAELGDSTSSSSSSSESEESEEEKKKSKKKKRAQKKKNKKNKVHFLKKERKTGAVARAFNFPVDVQQDKTVARLAHGVLSIVVPKKTPQVVAAAGEGGEEGHREVEIEHAGH